MNAKLQEQSKKSFMIYPNNSYKKCWDIIVTFALLFTCCVTPYRFAFVQEEPQGWLIINAFIDLMFLADIIFCFISAYYTEEFLLIDERKEIAKNYATGWFFIDTLAIFPFEQILGSGS